MRYRPYQRPLFGEWLRTLITICVFFCFLLAQAYNDHRNARVDSLEAALKSQNPPKGIDLLRAYDELMRGFLPYDSAKASDYGRKALALSYELGGLRVRADVLRRFAQMHYAREEYDEALRLFDQAMAVVDSMPLYKRYTESDVDDMRSMIYGAIANTYNMQDKSHLAIHYYQLALPIFEKYDWRESQVILYYNIGELYGQMGNGKEAERNYRKAIEKAGQSGDSLMMALPKKGLSGVYFNGGDYDNALQAVDEALDFYRAHRTEEPVEYAYLLGRKARILMMEGHEDVDAAKACANEALPYIERTEMMFDDASEIYMAACEVAMGEKRWQEALGYALKSVHPDSAATFADKGGYMLLAEIYTELGQKAKAREYMKKVFNLMNRYANDYYQSGLSQMEVLYETAQKEAQIAQLAKERRQQQWLLGLVAALLAAAIALIVYFQLVHRRQKALLAARVALETETKERHIMARDLHDSLGGMLSLLRLKIQAPPHDGSGAAAQEDETLRILDATIVELRRVSHHLMPEELLRNGIITALHDFALSVPGAQFQSYGLIQLDKERELTLYRCAYELVNNAIKHAKASHIDIQLMGDKQEITLTVSDDGQGIPSAPDPSPLTPHPGAGLQNIRERIAPYHGTLRIISNENEGTEINLSLPI